jgi:hypothetical protein
MNEQDSQNDRDIDQITIKSCLSMLELEVPRLWHNGAIVVLFGILGMVFATQISPEDPLITLKFKVAAYGISQLIYGYLLHDWVNNFSRVRLTRRTLKRAQDNLRAG